MLTQIDANNSLKQVEHTGKEWNSEGHVIGHINLKQCDHCRLNNDFYLTVEEVDKYKDEVKKCLPMSDTPVCNYYLE